MQTGGCGSLNPTQSRDVKNRENGSELRGGFDLFAGKGRGSSALWRKRGVQGENSQVLGGGCHGVMLGQERGASPGLSDQPDFVCSAKKNQTERRWVVTEG